jgi:hypothetical protein
LQLRFVKVGRIERTLFIIEWILDTDMQRRAQIGLNKGEAHHALKNALRIGRQGNSRSHDRGQHYRIAGLNLLTAAIIYWNTVHLGHAVTERRNEGLDVPPEFLPPHIPIGLGAHSTDWRISLAQGTESLGCHFALSRNRPQAINHTATHDSSQPFSCASLAWWKKKPVVIKGRPARQAAPAAGCGFAIPAPLFLSPHPAF